MVWGSKHGWVGVEGGGGVCSSVGTNFVERLTLLAMLYRALKSPAYLITSFNQMKIRELAYSFRLKCIYKIIYKIY